MDVVETWTAQGACYLQAALRESNEGFAARLGVAVRTVAAWHAQPKIVPRSEMQQALDTVYEKAPDSARQRFARLSGAGSSEVQPQALRVAIAVVIRDTDVLLVCRRGDGDLTWQFPAGMIKPGASAASVTVQETHAETGVHSAVRDHLGTRLHPATGVTCEYHLCEYLAGDATNRDVVENTDVAWVPIRDLARFIPADKIFPPILAALEAHT